MIFAIVSLICLMISLNVYVLSYFQVPIFNGVYLLHLPIFILFAFLFIKEKKWRISLSGHFNHIPSWLLTLSSVVLVIMCIGSFWGLSEMGFAGASEVDGKYILQNKGTYIKDISFEMYETFKRYELRFASTIWSLMYGFLLALHTKPQNK